MKKIIFILLFAVIGLLNGIHSQGINYNYEPTNAGKNAGMLFAGIALQGLGVGIAAGSVYLDLEVPGNGVTNITLPFGLTLAAGGTFILAKSVHNMVQARKARNEWRQKKNVEKITLNVEPTRYGIGLVCRF